MPRLAEVDDWVTPGSDEADDWVSPPSAPSKSSTAGAFARGAERGALPAAGGFAGFAAGASAVNAAGLPELAAMTGPAALAVEAVGSFVGGAAGAYGGATAVDAAQRWVLDHAPDGVVKALGLDKEQEQADVAEHPIASFTGELAPNLALFRPGAIAKTVKEGAPAIEKLLARPLPARAVPAVIMGAQEAATEGLSGEGVDPKKVAIAAGIGALSNRATALGRRIGRAGGRAGAAPVEAVRSRLSHMATPEEAAIPVLEAGSVDEAIDAARAVVDRDPIDINAMGETALKQGEDALKPLESAEPVPPVGAAADWQPLYDEDDAHIGWYDKATDKIQMGQAHPQESVEAGAAFTTAKGSTYRVHDDGSTSRDKAARPDVGHEGQSGPQPRSERTFYVTSEQADQLGLFQTQGPRKAIAERPDGTIGVKYLDGKDAGKFERRTVVKPFEKPAIGLTPVETWKNGERVHFGNEITEVSANSPSVPSTPQPRAQEPAETLPIPAETAPIEPIAARPEDVVQAAVQPETVGRLRGVQRRIGGEGPIDAATFLALKGGIKNDEGHDLTAGRGLQQFIPGVGPLIRPKGMSIDYAGEALHEAGYFGPPESTPRPTENQVLQFLEGTGRGPDNRPRKVYSPDDRAMLDQAEQSKGAEADNARMLQDIHDQAKAMGEALTDEQAHSIAEDMGARGIDPESALAEHIERQALREVYSDHEQTGDAAYADAIPAPRGQGEADLGAGEGVEGPEIAGSGEARPDEASPAAPEDTSPPHQLAASDNVPPLRGHVGSWMVVDRTTGKAVAEIFKSDTAINRVNFEKYKTVPADEYLGGLNKPKELATERGAEGFDQTILPGAEASARQLAQAREDQGHGRIPPKARQKPANEGLFGEGDDTDPVMFHRQEDRQPIFFSGLTRAVEGVKMEKAPPGQWEATIKNLPGVKAEELDWSGLSDFLRGQAKPVSKADVLAHLRENEVQVTEVEKGGDITNSKERMNALRPAMDEMVTRHGDMGFDGRAEARRAIVAEPGSWEYDTPEDRQLAFDYSATVKAAKKDPTKYGSYTLPGGENYRELLLTMPVKAMPRDAEKNRGDTFRSGHFEEPNVLAHVRFDERTVSEPGFAARNKRSGDKSEVFPTRELAEEYLARLPESIRGSVEIVPDTISKKVLHIAEVQSDWHQSGRKRGYAADRVQYEAYNTKSGNPGARFDSRDAADHYVREVLPDTIRSDVAIREIKSRGEGVPDAPFKTTWHELAMKRMLRYAAEHGYDRVSWDTGDTSAARYDLSKQVREINYERTGDGKYEIEALDHDGKKVIHEDDIPIERVEEIVGKDIAKKIADDVGTETGTGAYRQWKTLSGLDLKVGGEGMRGFYDKILPAAVNKMAKKWGTKVEPSSINHEPSGFVEKRWEGPYFTDEGVDQKMRGREWDALPVSIQKQVTELRDAMSEGAGIKDAAPNILSPRAAEYLGGALVDKPTAVPVHSVAITPAMREGVMQGQPMFQAQGEVRSGRVTGTFTPEFDGLREKVGIDLRARLDKMGLADIALKLPDAIIVTTPEGETHTNGAYAKKIIAVALEQSPDGISHEGVFDHETVHAGRALGLFTKSEWSILSNRAVRDWREKFSIDKRYPDLAEEKRNEEAIAEAYRTWTQDQGTQKGTLASIFNKVRDALSAIGNVFRGHGFATADSIFGKFNEGEIGKRPRAEAPATGPQFQVRDKESEGAVPMRAVLNKATGKVEFRPVSPPVAKPAPAPAPESAKDKTASAPKGTSLRPIDGTGEERQRTINGDLYHVGEEAPQLKAAERLVEGNFPEALAIAMRRKNPPAGLHPEFVYMAVEAKATKDGDFELMRKLSNSKIAEEATTMGQRIAAWRNRAEIAPVDDMRKIQDARTAKLKERGVDPIKAVETIVEQGQQQMKREAKSTKRPSWNDFIIGLVCPS